MKRFLSLTLLICLILSLTVFPVNADEANRKPGGIGVSTGGGSTSAYRYAVILNRAVNYDTIDRQVILQLASSSGEISVQSLSSKVTVNGTSYPLTTDEEMDVFLDAIPRNSFAKIKGQNNLITSIYFDNTPQSYTDVTYDTSTGQFSVNDIDTSGLPVYYGDFDALTEAYLDENHIYDIDVYDYGVHITDMTAATMTNTIKRIDIETNMNGNFLQNINITCETTDNNALLKVRLYDANSQLLDEADGDCTDEIIFYDLPNTAAAYTVEVFMADESGTATSLVYTKQYETIQEEINYFTVIDKTTSSGAWGETYAFLLLCDDEGTQYNVLCAEPVIINGTPFNDPQEIVDNIPLNYLYKLCENDESKITVIKQCDYSVNAIFSDITYENGLITGIVDYKCILDACDVLIGLYEDNVLIDIWTSSETISSTETEFEFSAESNKNYEIRAFFWGTDSLTPIGKDISTEISTEE